MEKKYTFKKNSQSKFRQNVLATTFPIKKILCCFIFLLSFFFSNAQVYVNTNVTGGLNDGSSWPNAYSILQPALDNATEGNEIWVAKGTYLPTEEPDDGTITIRNRAFHLANKDLKIYGGFAGTETLVTERDFLANPTILSGDFNNDDVVTGGGATLSFTNNGENAYHVFVTVGLSSASELDGFRIVGGKANNSSGNYTYAGNNIINNSGGGMYNYTSSPTITNTTFSGNSTIASGGGMFNHNSSSPTITNTTFSGNSSITSGGGMSNRNSSSPTITNTIFSGNSTENSGGGMNNSSSSPTIFNTHFSGNSSNIYGGGMFNGNSSPTITNTTFSRNSASLGGGMFNHQSSNPTLYNTVLYDNGTDILISSSSVNTSSSNNFCENFAQNGFTGLIADPFTNSADPDGADNIFGTADDGLVPAVGSVLINAGDSTKNTETTDIAGQARVQGTTIDVGAYEADPCLGIGNILYVDSTATTGTNSGANWANAFTSLETALALQGCPTVTEIRVASGTYKPSASRLCTNCTASTQEYYFLVDTDIQLKGSYNPATDTQDYSNPSILSGDFNNDDVVTGAGSTLSITGNTENAYHIIISTNLTTTAIIDGFKIRGGNAPYFLGSRNVKAMVAELRFAGGMYNLFSSPTITNVTFLENTAFAGGGMFNQNSSPIMNKINFSKNLTIDGVGGAMYNHTSFFRITNAIYSGNFASGGGGMFNYLSDPIFVNVIFLENAAGQGSVMLNQTSSPILTNVTIFGNVDSTIEGAIYNVGSSPTLHNTVLYGNGKDIFNAPANVHNPNGASINANSSNNFSENFVQIGFTALTADPFTNITDPNGADSIFATTDDGLVPAADSVLIDAGDTNKNTETTDIAGLDRVLGTTIDVGAYEAVPVNILVNTTTGNLEFTDNDARNDNLIISINGTNYRLTDPNNTLIAGIGAIQIDANTIEVPIASVTGSIIINTMGGNDTFTTDFSGGDFGDAINYNGGGQNSTNPGDILKLQGGGTFTSVEHTFISESDGNVMIIGNSAINYVGLEPIIDNLNVTDRVFSYTGITETVTLQNEATAGSNIIDSTLGESVTFTNPTNSLAINTEVSGGSGTDTILVEGLDAAFNANLTVNAGADDVVRFQTNPTDIDTGTYNVNAAHITSTANISTSGNGAIVFNALDYLDISTNAIITTEDGDINLNSNSAEIATANQFALSIFGNSKVRTTGMGSINLNGISKGISGGSFNTGVVLGPNAILENTGSGSINITGKGGVGTDFNVGVNLQAGVIINTIDGGIIINGTSGMGTGNDNFGINLYQGAIVEATGTGSITLDGTATAGINNNNGINIANAGTVIRAAGGAINLKGQGAVASTGLNNNGIRLSDGAIIQNTGSGAVNFTGFGGGGSIENNGVTIDKIGARIKTVDGKITINGTSGVGTITSTNGIAVTSGAIIEATGTGHIAMNGTSISSGLFRGRGIVIINTGTEVRTAGGGINLTGQGALVSTGSRNYGVSLEQNAVVKDSRNGNISVVGTGGVGADVNTGVTLRTGSSIRVTNGVLNINGTGGNATGGSNFGVGIVLAKAEATGTGSIIINGKATAGTDSNIGVIHSGSTAQIVSAGGGISVFGQGSGTNTNNAGVFLQNEATILDTAGGAISINGIGANALTNDSSGVYLHNLTSFSTSGNINVTGTSGNAISSAITLNGFESRILAGGVVTLTAIAGPLTTPTGIPTSSLITGSMVTLNGKLQAGNNTSGQLPITGNIILSAGDELSINIDGFTTPGTDYDQLKVTGTVDVTGATLKLVNSFVGTLPEASEFIIINNDGTDAVIGTFNGFPNKTAIPLNGQIVFIKYNGGDGNDVVLVVDSKPKAICKNFTAKLDAIGSVTILPVNIDGGSFDSDGPVTVSIDKANFTCANIGSNTVTLTVTDSTGNTATCITTVTIVDLIAPVVLTKDITIALDENGEASITSDMINNGSTDNCSIASLSLDKTSFTCANIGNNTITLTVTDESGNTASKTAIVTVEDNIAPIVKTKNITVELDAAGVAAIVAADVDNGSSDNCSIKTIALDKTSFNCSNIGENTVTLTVTDDNGNSASKTAIVTVNDKLAPIVITQNINVDLDAAGVAAIVAADVDNGSSDNCSIKTIALDVTSFDCSNIGENIVTLTITDINGNTASKTAIVTVKDKLAPIVITRNISVDLDATGSANIVPADIDNGSSDNCSIKSITLDITSFNCTSVGENTVTLTVTDIHGNSANSTATVTVVDTVIPVVSSVAPFTLALNDLGSASITAADIDNGSSDNCGITSMNIDVTSFDCSSVGENTITLTVTDSSGNIATSTTVVTIVDSIAPMVVTKDISVALDEFGNATIVASDIIDESFDACGIASMSLDKTSFSCPTLGDHTVTLTVIDANGNSTSEMATVTFTADDMDNDSIADVCDSDMDGDGVENNIDNCPTTANSDQRDLDRNGIGDVCDQGDLEIQKGFSPNGDGVNDEFIIKGLHKYPNNSIQIYNRNGNMVYESKNYQNYWDGISSGKSRKLPAAPYFYVLSINGGSRILKGWVYINY